jgi:hypothetical protein
MYARLIAIMLGRLEMSVEECIAAYLRLSAQAFTLNGGWLQSINVFNLDWSTWPPNIGAKFDSEALAAAIKELVAQETDDESALLLQDDPECQVYVIIALLRSRFFT